MTSSQLHALADRLARQERITHSEALSRLARRPRRNRKTVTAADRAAFATVEKPVIPYWWQAD